MTTYFIYRNDSGYIVDYEFVTGNIEDVKAYANSKRLMWKIVVPKEIQKDYGRKIAHLKQAQKILKAKLESINKKITNLESKCDTNDDAI